MTTQESKKLIINKLKELSQNISMYQVFNDVVICCAYSLANSIDFKQDREDRFNDIVKKYGENGIKDFAEILGRLFLAYQNEEAIDILGDIYMKSNFGNKNTGQFFTPIHICDLMPKLTIDEKEVNKLYKDKGYVSLIDSCCGSGRLLYAGFNEYKNCGVKPEDILIVGSDIDILCCCMSYIQLSLMGASAIINHKDSLSDETYDTFFTIGYAFNDQLKDKIQKEIENKNIGEIEV